MEREYFALSPPGRICDIIDLKPCVENPSQACGRDHRTGGRERGRCTSEIWDTVENQEAISIYSENI